MKKIGLKIIGTLIIISITINVFSMMSFASEKSELNQKIKETKENLNDVNSQKEESQNKVDDLKSQIAEYEKEINSLKDEIEQKQKEIKEMQEKLDKLEKERQEKQDLLDQRLITMYEKGETTYLDVLLSSADITDFISKYYMVETVTEADKELIEGLEADKKEIEETKNKLNASLDEVEKKKEEQESIQTKLNKAKNKEEAKVESLTEESHDLEEDIEAYEKKMKELDAKEKAQEEALKHKIEEAEKNHGSNSGSSGSSSSGGSVSSKGFIRPVTSGRITATMYYSSGKYHGAVDFGVSTGTPVYAAADGIVVTSTWGGSDSYGYYIKIKHYNGLYTLYAHGSSLVAKVGQEVNQGDLIMYSGNTGNSTGPHLHFEVRKSPGGYSNRVNPLNYLP